MATKTRSLADIHAEIGKLEAQANALREREAADVLPKIREAVALYGFTTADVFGKARAPQHVKVKTNGNRVRTKRRAKYRDDEGNEWSGIGKRPQWFHKALDAGKTPEELLVKRGRK